MFTICERDTFIVIHFPPVWTEHNGRQRTAVKVSFPVNLNIVAIETKVQEAHRKKWKEKSNDLAVVLFIPVILGRIYIESPERQITF